MAKPSSKRLVLATLLGLAAGADVAVTSKQLYNVTAMTYGVITQTYSQGFNFRLLEFRRAFSF